MEMMEICLILLMLMIQLSCIFADDYHDDEPGFWEGYWQNWKLNHKYNKRDFYRMCGNSTYRNNTMLINPKYPQSYVGGSRCSYRIYRENHKICQLRIDFLVFSLAQPSGDGICIDDYFTVENGNTTVPRLCGENKGHHVYVTFNKNFPLTIIVATTFQKTFNRRWQLRATQIKCKSHYIAPVNCLQYHIEPNGFIRSFNYGREENSNFNSIGIIGSRQIASLDYKICIKKVFCSITYTRPDSDIFAFTLTGDVKSVDEVILGTTALQSQACTTDFIVIPSPGQVSNGIRTALANDRFCGMGIGVINSATTGVRVVTDADENTDLGNRGFYLTYVQAGCFP